jgi:hypothetical protein
MILEWLENHIPKKIECRYRPYTSHTHTKKTITITKIHQRDHSPKIPDYKLLEVNTRKLLDELESVDNFLKETICERNNWKTILH